MFKRFLISLSMLIAALGFSTSAAFAAASPAVPDKTVVQVGVADVEPQATCSYRTKQAINIHSRPDRSSSIAGTLGSGAYIYNVTCDNVVGGNYSSCGGGNLWKYIGSGWVATKCLVRL
ncbi:hypothetical protein SAMN04489729_1576 [Amycolatopsis lurida]|uniref:SH3b domain-containing protein n=1 Tax=Amycolatopsis lurida NRRL 2430 TaxID=1460371 RepID=A0A2P2FZB0_AMYLU|nr:hypothetical protein [Amycolatopsis lurida]KFU82062.1 hypothetical protein BB31_06905 [Amycolatopsis lurida NRRL 2430]SEC43903.1 hypothetical protein SAMN04489729_1576 [Amycolatopsis lurida]